AGDVAVGTAEQLVAAAHGENARAAVDRAVQRVALRDEVARDERLLAVLAAADVEEVDTGGHVVLGPDRDDGQLVAPEPRPLAQNRDVAAVGVDVEVVRVEMADGDLHAADSQ